MARDPRLSQLSPTVRFLGTAENQLQRRKGELERYIVRFLAVHSPPDQLKSVVEDCELLAEDETLMNLPFIEEVCEAAHDELLSLLPFLPPGDTEKPRQEMKDGAPWGGVAESVCVLCTCDCCCGSQLIFCKEGKRGANAYVYPPLKLLLVVTHADSMTSLPMGRVFPRSDSRLEETPVPVHGDVYVESIYALIHPPQPLSASEFPEALEVYRRQLEEAFEKYIGDLCGRAACLADFIQANAKARYSTSVYSRFVFPAAAAAHATTTSGSTPAAADPHTPADGFAKDAETARQAAAGGAAAAETGADASEPAAPATAAEAGAGASEAAADAAAAAAGKRATAPLPASSSAAAALRPPAAAGTADTAGAAARAATGGGSFVPPLCPLRVSHFLEGGEKDGDAQDPGPFAKLTAVVSARRVNVESCWALAWTEQWEIYFSLRTRRLVVEGDVRIHSHSCEDWNAQVSYRRRFRKGSCRSSLSTAAAVASPTPGAASAAAGGPEEGLRSGQGDEQGAQDEADGLYVRCCDQVADPAALTHEVLQFIKKKNLEVVKEQEFFRYSYAPAMLKRLRRVLSLTGERFDWQQQQIHLQPRQQL